MTMLLIQTGVFAQETDNNDTLATDVKASIIVSSPLNSIYSSLGHTALRMECPSAKLDYIYSLETEESGLIDFITAQTKGKLIGAKTEEYLRLCSDDHRGVSQYELNLTLEQKRVLWRNLDQEMAKAPHLKFNIKGNQCSTIVLNMIAWSMAGERLDFAKVPEVQKRDGGDLLRWALRRSPWYAFWAVTFGGAECDKTFGVELTTVPETIKEVMEGATITDSIGNVRSALTGKESTLLPTLQEETTSTFTPTVVLGALLLIVLFITLGEWKWGWHRAALFTDVLLLGAQTLLGAILLYTSTASNICGTGWNWYLIPLNPLPLTIWVFGHKKQGFGRVYAIYTMVLLVFLLMTPLSSQIDFSHQLITAILALRCLSQYLNYRKTEGKK